MKDSPVGTGRTQGGSREGEERAERRRERTETNHRVARRLFQRDENKKDMSARIDISRSCESPSYHSQNNVRAGRRLFPLSPSCLSVCLLHPRPRADYRNSPSYKANFTRSKAIAGSKFHSLASSSTLESASGRASCFARAWMVGGG